MYVAMFRWFHHTYNAPLWVCIALYVRCPTAKEPELTATTGSSHGSRLVTHYRQRRTPRRCPWPTTSRATAMSGGQFDLVCAPARTAGPHGGVTHRTVPGTCGVDQIKCTVHACTNSSSPPLVHLAFGSFHDHLTGVIMGQLDGLVGAYLARRAVELVDGAVDDVGDRLAR